MSNYELHPYQQNFCHSVNRAFLGDEDHPPFQKVLATAATGAGKTIIVSALINHWSKKKGKKCLFIADTNELCGQAIDKLKKSRGIEASLEKAESRADRDASVVVASIQTISRRLSEWPKDHFGYVIADECHLAMSRSWQDTFSHFSSANVLGVTATPERSDKRSLMKFFEVHAAEIKLADLIDNRRLSPIVVETIQLDIAINSKITEIENEDVAAELAAYYDEIISAIIKHGEDRRKILWFHPSVNASKQFTELLESRGEKALHIDGTSDDREGILREFRDNPEVRHLNNCQLLGKGFDQSNIDAVVVLKPTKSRTSYIQMVGRGTRIYCQHGCAAWCDHADRKQNMKLFDFLWAYAEKNVMGPSDLMTDDPEESASISRVLREGDEIDIQEGMERALCQRSIALLEAMRRAGKYTKASFTVAQWCALMDVPQLLTYEPMSEWEKAHPTQEQMERLTGPGGLSGSAVKTRGLAHELLEVMEDRYQRGLCSPKQAFLLIRNGVDHPHRIKRWEASKMIDAIITQSKHQ